MISPNDSGKEDGYYGLVLKENFADLHANTNVGVCTYVQRKRGKANCAHYGHTCLIRARLKMLNV